MRGTAVAALFVVLHVAGCVDPRVCLVPGLGDKGCAVIDTVRLRQFSATEEPAVEAVLPVLECACDNTLLPETPPVLDMCGVTGQGVILFDQGLRTPVETYHR